MGDVSLLTKTHSPIELRRNILSRLVDVAFIFEPSFVDELITTKVLTVPLHLVSTQANTHYEPQSLDNYILVDYGDTVNSEQMKHEHRERNKLFIVADAPIYSREIYSLYLANSYKNDIIEQAIALFPFIKV